jgi:hypothetical protein
LYTIRRADGSAVSYVAGPTMASLPRSMPVGTVILKKKWETGYEIDGDWGRRRSAMGHVCTGRAIPCAGFHLAC